MQTNKIDGYFQFELPQRKSEAIEAQKFMRGMTSEKAKKAMDNTKALINARFEMIHLQTQEMLQCDGPEHKMLLDHMENSLNYNLDVTQKQYANARRELMEERIKFWKKFKNNNKKWTIELI